jgi:hypothetical protein
MEEISTRVLSLDKRIRFAGVVTRMGEVIKGGFQEEAKPLLDQNKEQQLYLESLSAIGSLREYSDNLGDLIYNITEYRKVILMTFPLKESNTMYIFISWDRFNEYQEPGDQINRF